MWWALHIGLPYGLALELPFGELMDLIAVDLVRSGELALKSYVESDGDFWSLMDRK